MVSTLSSNFVQVDKLAARKIFLSHSPNILRSTSQHLIYEKIIEFLQIRQRRMNVAHNIRAHTGGVASPAGATMEDEVGIGDREEMKDVEELMTGKVSQLRAAINSFNAWVTQER